MLLYKELYIINSIIAVDGPLTSLKRLTSMHAFDKKGAGFTVMEENDEQELL
jgi:hypothetical protein